MTPPPPDQHKPLPPTPTSPPSHRPNLSLDTSSNETFAANASPPSVVLDTPSSFGTPYMDPEDSPEGGYGPSSSRMGAGSGGGGLEVEPPLGAAVSPSLPSSSFVSSSAFSIRVRKRRWKDGEDASECIPRVKTCVDDAYSVWDGKTRGNR